VPGTTEKSSAIVFGGAGFIGTHLLRHLVGRGVERVVSFDIAEPAAPVPGVDYVRGDVREEIPANVVSSIPEIYDLAAVHRTPGHPDHEYYETNVQGALNISDFARQAAAPQIVFTSSIAVYGPDEAVKTEESDPDPVSAYGWSKLLAEQVYQNWAQGAADRKLVIARPAVVFGKGENGNFTRLAGALRRRSFVYPGRTDTIKACGYVGELIRALDFARTLEHQETLFNFCYPESYTIERICQTFEKVGELPRPLGKVPLPLLNAAALPFETLNGIGVRNPVNRERIAKLVRSTNIQPARLGELGYEFETDLAGGLHQWAETSERRFV
jgi:nucleoside-diphosphate-sugar epimerase